jgi:hypothetical protein
MKFRNISMLVCLVGAATLGTSPAFGQGHAQTRSGFWFNGGLGYGSLGCNDCGDRTGGLSGGLSVGGTLSSRVLLGIGTTGWMKSDQGYTMSTGTLDARIRFYPSATGGLYLTGGLGLGQARVETPIGDASEMGFGFVVGMGYDIRIANNLSLTPFWTGFAVQSDNLNMNVGQIGLSITAH